MMILLPGFVFCFMLVRTYAGIDSTTSADSHSTRTLRCPGECKDEHICSTTLNETDCDHGMVCCVDHFDDITTTEFADLDLTTQSTTAEVETYTYATEADTEESSEEYTYVYSDDPEESMVEQELENIDTSDSCPGTCQSYETAASCKYVIATENMCPSGLTCCVTESDMSKTNDQYVYEIEDESAAIVERDSGFEESSDSCPGTCVHPSHAMFCEEILPHFQCPLNAKCCVKRSMERALPGSVVQCNGQCLPPNMYGFCFPPSEFVIGETNCPRGSSCCMSIRSSSLVNAPSVNRIKFPGFPQNFVPAPSRVLMGHLAIDDEGTIYKVSPNGQIFQLPKLTPADHARNEYTEITSYPQFNGEIIIFSDASGGLYQQFFRRQLAPLTVPETSQKKPRSPATSQFHSQAAENAATPSMSAGDGLEDVVIPDDDDEAPVTTSTPVVHDDKNSRPPCPGSCMSYFLRFTCFRGYATYDGFTCPGRSVCCARLKDIEDHEAYLKSLSPYFNVPPTNRDSSLPRCGLKGRRDTPRIMGGKESLPGEWCWQVAIINVQNQYICGGALIDNSWVLTAAHCVVGPVRENQALFVRVGVTDLKSPEDNSRGQTMRVLSTFLHHNFDSKNLDNNIALLRLQKPVELNSGVCVICLPTTGRMPEDNSRCTVTGYGFMSKDGDMSLKIMDAQVPIINSMECMTNVTEALTLVRHSRCTVTGYGFMSKDGDMSLKIMDAQVPIINSMECMTNVTEALTNPFILPSSSFCAGGHGQQDACQGDAGGPLACEVGGYHELVGLVSWGLGCDRDDVPSIYVKVPSFMGWVNQIISSSSFLMSLN